MNLFPKFAAALPLPEFLAKYGTPSDHAKWDRAKAVPLAAQDIVLTVPASFDEEARELTVMALQDRFAD